MGTSSEWLDWPSVATNLIVPGAFAESVSGGRKLVTTAFELPGNKALHHRRAVLEAGELGGKLVLGSNAGLLQHDRHLPVHARRIADADLRILGMGRGKGEHRDGSGHDGAQGGNAKSGHC
ncbi:MAG: hypothetical protein WDN31_18635 [Hyphomicrobium sp.]